MKAKTATANAIAVWTRVRSRRWLTISTGLPFQYSLPLGSIPRPPVSLIAIGRTFVGHFDLSIVWSGTRRNSSSRSCVSRSRRVVSSSSLSIVPPSTTIAVGEIAPAEVGQGRPHGTAPRRAEGHPVLPSRRRPWPAHQVKEIRCESQRDRAAIDDSL
jgi:hypothetical protein